MFVAIFIGLCLITLSGLSDIKKDSDLWRSILRLLNEKFVQQPLNMLKYVEKINSKFIDAADLFSTLCLSDKRSRFSG